MLRRGRNSRARHLTWSDTRQETDVLAADHSTDGEERESQAVTQISDLEPEVDYPDRPASVSEVVPLPSTPPLTGESFCLCEPQEEVGQGFGVTSDCVCGEEDQAFDWVWDERCMSSGAFLSCDDRKVSFHSDYSCGTAAIRGTKELSDGQHYWEVKMTSPVYGTDMMVGIGTSEVNLEMFKYSFGSLLGHDEDSWGLSYMGLLQHKGDKVKFSSRFSQGSIIGVHLDTWHGTLTFYKNRHCIGVAATRLQNKKFYPMVCSTAAKSSMKVIRACHTPTSLQYLCCARLRQTLPCCPDVAAALELPPGLRVLLQNHLGWVFALSSSPDSSSSSSEEEEEAYFSDSCQRDGDKQTSVPSSPVSTLSACASLSPDPFDCPRHTACHCPPTPPSSDYDSCCSEPEDYQCKRCRWT
ncbi:SPRY domain-containing SOCS box protein 3 isoform X2 [Kryptolebias marmoratus]|nr:SPRY domain-containing SOCS box protein 3 isoform X2 [Kryptolebias marmoratus]